MENDELQVAFLDRQQPELSENEALKIAESHFGIRGVISPLISERDQNFRIQQQSGQSVVLKISNANQQEGVTDLQCQALSYLYTVDPELRLPRLMPTLKGAPTAFHKTPAGIRHIVWMVSYLPGSLLANVLPQSPQLRRQHGALLARLDLALRGFFHSHARHNHPWDLTRCPTLLPYTHYIKDRITRKSVETILQHMDAIVLPRLRRFRHQIIHQDGHSYNILVDENDPGKIDGLIDFGDMVHGPLVCELAVAASSSVLDDQAEDPVQAICEIAAGYDRILPLEAEEVDLLYDLVLARHALTIVIAELRKERFPGDAPHADLEEGVNENLAGGIASLQEIGRAEVSDRIRAVCGFPPYFPSAARQSEQMLARRMKRLGQYAPHFYTRPLHLERGEGVWLYGADGQRYLDCYNNIPQVGHGHPRVVRAIARQAAALNTHTRYLYRSILDYAERLTSLLPEHLSACLFVNSGSEANDVAFQMAQMVSGQQGAVIMEDAYHGITQSIMALSPEGTGHGLAAHVAGLRVPDPYAGELRAGKQLGKRYAADADQAVALLAKRGFGVAALMIDPSLCSSGIPAPPPDYFPKIVDRVRAGGGLVICDEVQSGFGRLGAMWGHVLRGIKADIVTMGKPVANGFPLGVVVTRPEILDTFSKHTGLFSTFGGNPVACAAGLAVLEIIEEQALVENARRVGNYLRQRLRQLMDVQPFIGDVRGEGLLTGIALVTDRETRAPAAELVKPLLEELRRRGVLVGNTGRHGNILKIRPPIIFSREHADLLVQALAGALDAVMQSNYQHKK